MRARFRLSLLMGLLLAHAIGVPVAWAGSFQITPILVEVTGTQKAATYTLSTPGPEPVTVQVDAYHWQQDAGGERYTPATDVVTAPRVVTLRPGTPYIVRVARRAPASREVAYRVHFREVPPPVQPGMVGIQPYVIQNVPLFFGPSGTHQVRWSGALAQDGTFRLGAVNTGSKYLRAQGVRIVDGRGAVLAERQGPTYVLAGATVAWPLTTHARLERGDTVHLQFEQDGQRQDIPLTIE